MKLDCFLTLLEFYYRHIGMYFCKLYAVNFPSNYKFSGEVILWTVKLKNFVIDHDDDSFGLNKNPILRKIEG